MRDYYQQARDLNQFSETVLARASQSATKASRRWGRRPSRIPSDPLSISNGHVQLEGEVGPLTSNPMLLFDAFALAQAADVPLSQTLRDAMRQSLAAVDLDFRRSHEASRAFMKLLARRGRAGYVLRMMHEIGFLTRFVPEFRRINLLIQHDLYHHYTADEHTLKAVEALDELTPARTNSAHIFAQSSMKLRIRACFTCRFSCTTSARDADAATSLRGAKLAERICKRLQPRQTRFGQGRING